MTSRLLTFPALAACLLSFLLLPSVWAVDYAQPFFPHFLHDLPHRAHRTVQLPGRLNVNLADINQLMAIPTITENVALKIIRHRPYRDPSDLQRIASLSQRERERLVRIAGTRLQFSTANSGERLRQ